MSNYEYFSGANCVVEVDGFPVLELAGISLDSRETRRPLYGYSSVYFDTVARGQQLVQGSFLINYVHEDYLFEALRFDPDEVFSEVEGYYNQTPAFAPNRLKDFLLDGQTESKIKADLAQNVQDDPLLAQAFIQKYFGPDPTAGNTNTRIGRRVFNNTVSPIDLVNPFNIRIAFGERNVRNGYTGFTGKYIDSVYCVSRGMMIQISEDVILEEYGFFARSIESINTDPYDVTVLATNVSISTPE